MKSMETRLSLAFFCIILLLAIQGVVAYHNIRVISVTQAQAYEHRLHLNDIRLRLAGIRLLVFEILGTMNPAQMDFLNAKFKAESTSLEKALLEEGLDRKTIESSLEIYGKIIRLHYDFSVRTARELINGDSKILDEALVSKLGALSRMVREKSEERIRSAYRRTLQFTFGLLLLAIFIASFWAIILARTLTDRHQAEADLKESRERYRRVYETAPLGFVVWNGRCEIMEWNDQAEKIFEWTRREVAGKNFFDLIIPDMDLELVERVVADLLKGKIQKRVVHRNVTKSGNVIWCEWNHAVLRDTHGNISGAMSLGLNITDRVNAENELRSYREHLELLVAERTAALEAKNKELKTFTYSVSHDLKAPLRGIDGYSRLLMEEYADKLDEEGIRFLKNVRLSAEQMNQLIEDLLTYSRMERREIQLVRTNIPSMIDVLVQERGHELKTRGIRLTQNVPFDAVLCDDKSMRQVLGNLLDNAAKFTRDVSDPAIEIGGSETDENWTLWVKDNGIGLAPKYQDRIFGIFQRLHRAEDYPGTGVGLAIVKKAVDRMGGKVWVESVLKKGATFYLQLPKSNNNAKVKG